MTLIDADGPVGTRVRAVVGVRRLVPLFEVHTSAPVLLESDAVPAGEIALDETAIHIPAGGPRRASAESRSKRPSRRWNSSDFFVRGLASACALQPASLSKYEAGRLSSALEPPVPLSLGPTDIDPDKPIRAVALAVLWTAFRPDARQGARTRLGDDIEELHDMRVAARRLRAAPSLFADVLPATVMKLSGEPPRGPAGLSAQSAISTQLEQLDRWLTEVPELDRSALAALRGLLEAQRAAARKEMLEMLDSRRYEVFVGRFARTLRARHESRSGPAAQLARTVAPDLIEDRFRLFLKAAAQIRPESQAWEYHRRRARGKRARYTIEFLADLYPGREAPVLKALVAVQDILGLHQDADVAIDRLRSLASLERDLGPQTIFAMGRSPSATAGP